MTIPFNFIQTFFVDPEAVSFASEILLTSAEVWFNTKPDPLRNTSGSQAPGVVVSICEVIDQSPDIDRIIPGSTTRVDYDSVYAFSDASVPTIFSMASPVTLKTDRFYGLVISFEDSQYEVWVNKQGDRLVGTNIASSGSGNSKDGKFFQRTNANLYTALNDTDLKYRVNCAKFTSNTLTVSLVNRDYEFLSLSSANGIFKGGEFVYQAEANATGNIAVTASNTTIVGSGTDFTVIIEGGYIVSVSGTGRQVMQVHAVTNATHMVMNTVPSFTNAAAKFFIAPVGRVYWKDDIDSKLFLVDSSANTSLKFDAAGVVRGELSTANGTISSVDNYDIDQFIPKFAVDTTASATSDLQYTLSYSNGSAQIVNTSLSNTAALNKTNRVTAYDGQIMSRSSEVSEASLYGTNRKSGVVTLTVDVAGSSNSLFNVPRIRTDEVDFFVLQNLVNNEYANGSIDSEVYRNGLATSKYISLKTAFANNRFAEDIRVYVTAHKPVGTSIRVYAKVHNSNDPETFDDKLWTPLRGIQNADKYSSTEQLNDLIEYEYTFQKYPDSEYALPGTFTTSLSSAVLTAGGFDPSANIAANDLVKLYNPLIPENYMIAVVTAANSTTVTISDTIANNNVVGSGYLLDKLLYKGTAFQNGLNSNVSRYFTSTYAPVDKFDSMQLKVVLLSNSTSIIPSVEEIQAIGVNAGS